MIHNFEDFINEDFTYDVDIISDFTFDDGWYFYEPEDEIIYRSDNEPVDINCLFYFNTKECSVYIGGKKLDYDINDPKCLIKYLYKDNEVKIFRDDEVIEYLETIGCGINDREKIQKHFSSEDDKGKSLLIHGQELVACTFDIIEE